MDIGEALLSAVPRLREKARRSSNYIMIQCPYHGGGQENTPSCVVALDKPVFFCHGCKESGHVSRLFRTFEIPKIQTKVILGNAGFADARKEEELGVVELSRKRKYNVFRGPFVLPEQILDKYRMAPTALLQAGFTKTTLRHFEVGFDQYEGRITFPLRNVFGDLVGLSGRTIIDGVEPRYKIYKRELVRMGAPDDYSLEEVKKSILWHAHVVRPILMRTEEPLIITEGFKACMWIWQAGYESCVALVGSYLTQRHAELISRYVKQVVLFLDDNSAGWTGTRKAGLLLLKRGVSVRVANYPRTPGQTTPDSKQPDQLIPDEIDHSIETAKSYLRWRKQNGQDSRLLHREAQSIGA